MIIGHVLRTVPKMTRRFVYATRPIIQLVAVPARVRVAPRNGVVVMVEMRPVMAGALIQVDPAVAAAVVAVVDGNRLNHSL